MSDTPPGVFAEAQGSSLSLTQATRAASGLSASYPISLCMRSLLRRDLRGGCVRSQAHARRASSAAGPTLRASGHAPARCGHWPLATGYWPPGPAIPCKNDVLTCPLTEATVLARGHAG